MKYTLSTWFIRLDESQPLILLRLQQQGSNVQPESKINGSNFFHCNTDFNG